MNTVFSKAQTFSIFLFPILLLPPRSFCSGINMRFQAFATIAISTVVCFFISTVAKGAQREATVFAGISIIILLAFLIMETYKEQEQGDGDDGGEVGREDNGAGDRAMKVVEMRVEMLYLVIRNVLIASVFFVLVLPGTGSYMKTVIYTLLSSPSVNPGVWGGLKPSDAFLVLCCVAAYQWPHEQFGAPTPLMPAPAEGGIRIAPPQEQENQRGNQEVNIPEADDVVAMRGFIGVAEEAHLAVQHLMGLVPQAENNAELREMMEGGQEARRDMEDDVRQIVMLDAHLAMLDEQAIQIPLFEGPVPPIAQNSLDIAVAKYKFAELQRALARLRRAPGPGRRKAERAVIRAVLNSNKHTHTHIDTQTQTHTHYTLTHKIENSHKVQLRQRT
jgi:hypothetical protein